MKSRTSFATRSLSSILLLIAALGAVPASAQEVRVAVIPHLGSMVAHTSRGWEPVSYVGSISVEGSVTQDLCISVEPALWLLGAACDDFGSDCAVFAPVFAAGVVWRPDASVVSARAGVAKPIEGRKAWMPYAGLDLQARPRGAVSLWAGLRYQPLFHEAQVARDRYAMRREDIMIASVGLRIGGRRSPTREAPR